MELNKSRVVTEAKYKRAFYSSLEPGRATTADQVMQKLQAHAYEPRKYEIDRKYYSSTYQLSYGKEKFAPI